MKRTTRITVAAAHAAGRQKNERGKDVPLKNYVSFMDCKINNSQGHNATDLDVSMHMYNLIEYGDNYSKTSKTKILQR